MSKWFLTGLLVGLAFLVTGCSSGTGGNTRGKVAATSHRPDYARGKAVYNAYCADCHDDSESGAPMLDEPEDWDQRALGLTAVLEAHASHGFLKMPGQGKSGGVSDEQISDAVHFMMRELAAAQ